MNDAIRLPMSRHAAIPKIVPTAAVNAIASVPQKQTRKAPRMGEAPPVTAAIAPKAVNSTIAKRGTSHINKEAGAIEAVKTGTAAPEVNAAADQKAA